MTTISTRIVLSLGLQNVDEAISETSSTSRFFHLPYSETSGPEPSPYLSMSPSTIMERDPHDTHAYLVGGGIASLVAAVHLVHDANVPATQVHIIEAAPNPGGALHSRNNEERGYSVRGARKLNFTYHCLYDTLAKVPSGKDGRTILQEINSFNKYFNRKTSNPARLVGDGSRNDDGDDSGFATSSNSTPGPEILDATKLTLEAQDRVKLLALLLDEEDKFEHDEIQHCFDQTFFESYFWDMWSTMYSFQPWHSAKEFRRYLHRFLHEFPNLQSFAGIERTPMNDFESVIMPLEGYLKDAGVDFRYATAVTSVEFADSGEICVSKLNVNSGSNIDVRPQDIVLITLGSMVSSCMAGTNTEPTPPTPHQDKIIERPPPVWKFWSDLANPDLNPHASAFGRPKEFYSRINKSSWLSFTVTLKKSNFMEKLAEWTGIDSSSYPLITFRDSPWLISLTVPNQPYFLGQSTDTLVFWGYGLFPDQDGIYVRKPMTKCTGQEIFEEVLGHLNFPVHPMIDKSITIPVFMPFIGSPFLTRQEGDRPQVVPEKSRNIGLMGQFVEIEKDVTFTMEYSARSAQTAVFQLMGLRKKPREVFSGDHSVKVLGEALKAIMV